MLLGKMNKAEAKNKADFYNENALKIQNTTDFMDSLTTLIKDAATKGDFSIDVDYESDNLFSAEINDFLVTKGYKLFKPDDYTLTISWR